MARMRIRPEDEAAAVSMKHVQQRLCCSTAETALPLGGEVRRAQCAPDTAALRVLHLTARQRCPSACEGLLMSTFRTASGRVCCLETQIGAGMGHRTVSHLATPQCCAKHATQNLQNSNVLPKWADVGVLAMLTGVSPLHMSQWKFAIFEGFR